MQNGMLNPKKITVHENCERNRERVRFKSLREKERASKNSIQNNYDNINTSIKSNPDARVSFGQTPLFHHAATFANKNPLVAEAIFALLITCLLRPISIMATASDEDEKKKCEYQAAKSISSGIVGFAMTALVGTVISDATAKANEEIFDDKGNKIKESFFDFPKEGNAKDNAHNIIRKGINALTEVSKRLKIKNQDDELANLIDRATDEKNNKINLEIIEKSDKTKCKSKTFAERLKSIVSEDTYKIIKEALSEQKAVHNFRNTAKNVADKLFQPVFMPLRAMVTIALIPILLKGLGLSKPGNNHNTETSNMCKNMGVFEDERTRTLFQSFTGVAKYENK